MKNLIFWLYRKWALHGLKRRYLKEMAIDTVLKEWVTDCIIERKQEGRRKELVELQNKLKESEIFYKWLLTKK